MDLDPVREEFLADVGPWLAGIDAAIEAAQHFRDEVVLLQGALDALPLERTVHLRFDTSGIPESLGAGAFDTSSFEAAAEAMRASAAAAFDDTAAKEADTSATLDNAKAEYMLAMAERMRANSAREATGAGFDQTAATLASIDATLSAARAAGTYDAAMKVLGGEFENNAKAAGSAAASTGRYWSIWRFLTRDVSLFGGALGSLPIVGVVGGFHILTDAVIETTAVVVPATVAFGAFGAAAVPTLQDIYTRMKAVDTASTAFGQNIYPMTGGLQAMAQAVQPEVYQLFGQALVVMNDKTGEFTTIARQAGAVLDQLGARAAVAFTSGGMGQFLAHGPADLAQIGDIIGNIFGTVGNALRVMPGYAEALLHALDDVTRGIESITGSGLGQWVLGAGMAFHGAVLWLGLGATAAVTLGNALVGLAAKFGLASEGALAFDAAQFGAGIRQMLGGVTLLGSELLAMSSAEDVAAAASLSLEGAMSALAAVNPLVWVGGAVAGLAMLADHVIHASNATSDYVTSAQQALGTVPVSQLAVSLTQEQARNTAALRDAQTALNDSTNKLSESQMLSALATGSLSGEQRQLWGNYLATAGLAQQLTTDQKNYNTVLAAAGGNVGLLSAAGITSNQIMSASAEQLKQLALEARAAAAAQEALALGTGRQAAALNAQRNNFINEMVPAIQRVIQAEDALLNVVTGGEQSFVSFQQSIQGTSASFTQPSGLGPSAKLAGASLSGLNEQSLYLANTFYGIAVPALQKLTDSLQLQHISAGNLTKVIATGAGEMLKYTKGNTEANATITALINNALGPGTVSLQNLNTWVKNNSTSLQGMNAIVAQSTIQAGTLANVLETQLNAQFRAALLQYSGADTALKTYTNDLLHLGANVAATEGARAQLIADLRNAGFGAQQAASYVDSLSTAIRNMPSSKTVTITTIEQAIGAGTTAPGVSAPHHAAGARIPGYGGGDIVPAMLEPGEAVVPKHLVPAVAPFLSAHHVPGFAAGGIAHGGMSAVAAQWARELWRMDLHGHGPHDPLSKAATEGLLHALYADKKLRSDPLYRLLEGDLGKYVMPYAAKDLLYWKVAGERAALLKSEAKQIAHDQHEILLHQRKHDPGWVRYYEHRLADLEHTDAAKAAGFAREMALLRREGFSSGGLVRSYDQGGYLPVGLSMAYNGTGKPEPVGAATGQPIHVHTHVNLDGREIAEVITPHMVGTVNEYNYLNSGRPSGVLNPGGL